MSAPTCPSSPFSSSSRSCVRLPDVLEAYDGTGSYTKEQRHLLVSHLENPDQRKHPWPAKLDVAFGIEDPEEVAAREAAAAAAAAEASAAEAGEGDGVKIEAVAGQEGGAGAAGVDGTGTGDASSLKGAGDARGRGGGKGGGGGAGAGGGGGRSSGKGKRGFAGKGAGAGAGIAAATGGAVLLGSPMLDATLEDTQGLREVIETLKQETGLSEGRPGGLQMEVSAWVCGSDDRHGGGVMGG